MKQDSDQQIYDDQQRRKGFAGFRRQQGSPDQKKYSRQTKMSDTPQKPAKNKKIGRSKRYLRGIQKGVQKGIAQGKRQAMAQYGMYAYLKQRQHKQEEKKKNMTYDEYLYQQKPENQITFYRQEPKRQKMEIPQTKVSVYSLQQSQRQKNRRYQLRQRIFTNMREIPQKMASFKRLKIQRQPAFSDQIKDYRQPAYKQVVREIPVYIDHIVNRIVQKQVIKQVPVQKIIQVIKQVPIQKIVQIIREVPIVKNIQKIKYVPVQTIVQKVRQVPVQKIIQKIVEVKTQKIVQTVRQVPIQVIKTIKVQVPVVKEVIKEVIKQVPVQVVKQIKVPVEVIKQIKVPYQVVKQVPVPVQVIKEVIKQVKAPEIRSTDIIGELLRLVHGAQSQPQNPRPQIVINRNQKIVYKDKIIEVRPTYKINAKKQNGIVLVDQGKLVITINFKASENLYYIGQYINGGKIGNSYFTTKYITLTPQSLPLLSTYYLELQPQQQGILLFPGKMFGLIKDKYKGQYYYGLRRINFYQNKPQPTRQGFNLTQKEYQSMIYKLSQSF